VLRAKIVLHRASGESFRDIGQALGCDHRTAWWAAPKPFVWTASANDILAKVTRARQALAAIRTASTKG
jgi:hypothetical protein